MSKNYYESLGISKSASANDIKKAYKKMAMKYHPDRNKGDAEAEKKFKEINEAYQILGDEQKKKNYDQFGSADFGGFNTGSSNGNPFGWGFSGNYSQANFDFSDLFSQFSNSGKSQNSSNFWFDFWDLFSGHFSENSSSQNKKSHKETPQKENLDVTETIEIPFLDFLFDTKVSVKNVYNKIITLKVKAFTQPWTKFKIKGEGRSINGKTGDMFVIVNAKMPKEISPQVEKMLEAIRYEL